MAELRGEIAQEFNSIEYEIRATLALFLSELDRPLKKLRTTGKRKPPGCKLNPAVLSNADVKLMDSELAVADIARSGNVLKG
jgi:hypothetical protein